MTLLPEAEPYVAFQHPGAKFLHFLSGTSSGRVIYRYGTKAIHLAPGDTLQFEATALHGIEDDPVSHLSVVFTLMDQQVRVERHCAEHARMGNWEADNPPARLSRPTGRPRISPRTGGANSDSREGSSVPQVGRTEACGGSLLIGRTGPRNSLVARQGQPLLGGGEHGSDVLGLTPTLFFMRGHLASR